MVRVQNGRICYSYIIQAVEITDWQFTHDAAVEWLLECVTFDAILGHTIQRCDNDVDLPAPIFS